MLLSAPDWTTAAPFVLVSAAWHWHKKLLPVWREETSHPHSLPLFTCDLRLVFQFEWSPYFLYLWSYNSRWVTVTGWWLFTILNSRYLRISNVANVCIWIMLKLSMLGYSAQYLSGVCSVTTRTVSSWIHFLMAVAGSLCKSMRAVLEKSQ